MNYSIYRVSLDIHDTSSQVMLNVKKGDSKRKILITLTDGGKPYAIASDCSAVFRAKKPDGTVLYNDCTISNNVITYSLTNQTSASVGVVECEVTVYGGDNRQITSPRFALCVEDSICSDSEIESTNEFTALAQTISQANNINATVSKVGDTATISITKKDGSVVSASVSDGKDGTDGISVTGVTINSGGHLILALSSGATIDAGMVKGTPGDAGYSPTATVSKSGSVATITIKDKNGTTTATVSDGSKGEPGDDGVSPSVSVSAISGGHRITITDAIGSHSFDVMDGTGSGSGDMEASVYDPQGKAQDIFAYADTKQSAIPDLATIRSNASAGASKVSCTDETVAGFGYTKNTGTYSKPSGGIPKADLASDVQTSLGKADTAYVKPSTGIPKTDLASDVQTSLGNSHTHSNKTVLDTITGSETWTFTLSNGTTVTKKVVVV